MEGHLVFCALLCWPRRAHFDLSKSNINPAAALDAQAGNSTTALFAAAKEGHAAVVQMLLEAGADRSITNANGFTPLAIAQKGKGEA